MSPAPDPEPPIGAADPAAVEAYLHEHIPISAAMGIRVARAGSDAVELYAPLEPNINHRSTVFGGSAISVAILAAWTLVHLRVTALGGKHRVVIRHGEMDYTDPITGAFHAVCTSPGAETWLRFTHALERRGQARIALEATVTTDATRVATFSATFAALRIDG